jgi:hypothetical protein
MLTFDLILYALLAIACFLLFLRPHGTAADVSERAAQGDDRFFEEQRSYRAYPFLASWLYYRVGGAIGTILFAALCALEFWRG